MTNNYTQLEIFEKSKPKRIFHRGWNGQFKSTEPTSEERLQREVFLLRNKNEELERKVSALVRYQRILLTK